MLAIKHILFPMDFSDRCLGAAPFVEAIASRFGAKVTMLGVAEPITYAGMGEPGPAIVIDMDAIRSGIQSRLDGTLLKELAGVPVERIAEIGDPAETILEFTDERKVDLIMMPTHGYGPFRRLLLGSVTAKVLHDAHCPVWTGAHMEEPPIHEHVAMRTLLCAVDRTEKSVPVMKWAAQFACDSGATLRLVHAVSGVEGWPERQLDREFEEAIRTEARNEISALQDAAKVHAPLCIAVGDVASAVRDEARRHNADLLLIGRGVIHENLGRLRTHAHGIIRQAPCPVISV